jgi:NADPH-dependent ferric siderophore reductase
MLIMTIVLPGDSITAGGEWGSRFPGCDARNFVISGDTTAKGARIVVIRSERSG